MRVLITTRPAFGHCHPLLPLARALESARHEVAFATGDPFTARVEAAGFTAFSAGLSVDRYKRELDGRFGGLERIPCAHHRTVFFGQVFSDLEVPARLRDLRMIVERWVPDLLVHGIAEFAGPLAVGLAGIPYATCGFGPLLQPDIAELAGRAAGRHWEAAGLDPLDARMYRSLYLDPCPPSLQVPAIEELTAKLEIRPEAAEPDGVDLVPPPLVKPSRDRTVYLTLGTIFNRDIQVFKTVLEALAEQPVNVIATIGPDGDPNAFEPRPDNAYLARYIPQAQLLPHCDLVICHGGASSTFGALSLGLPVLLLPRGADNFYNAERVIAAGAGRGLLDAEITAESVANEVAFLLEDPRCRAAARMIAQEIAAMPAPAAAVPALESLVGAGVAGLPASVGFQPHY